jgi:hypothetical protein
MSVVDRAELVAEKVQTRRLVGWLESGEPLFLRIGEGVTAKTVELSRETQADLRRRLVARSNLRIANIDLMLECEDALEPGPGERSDG